MDYSNLEGKGFGMLASVLLCARKEQNLSFRRSAMEANVATSAGAAGEAELWGGSPGGRRSIQLGPIAFCIRVNGQRRSRDSLDCHHCCLKIPQENISDRDFSESPFPTKGLKENFVR